MEAWRGDQCRAWVGFSSAMAHRITAGADILLMPSRFEPCGLNQVQQKAQWPAAVLHGSWLGMGVLCMLAAGHADACTLLKLACCLAAAVRHGVRHSAGGARSWRPARHGGE
jgi:hypothetical protein